MQTVNQTYMWVNTTNMISATQTTGGNINGREARRVKELVDVGLYDPAGDPLMPVFDEDGNVIGYERHMAPEMLQKLHRNTHLGQMCPSSNDLEQVA
jgi:hypothetical protein